MKTIYLFLGIVILNASLLFGQGINSPVLLSPANGSNVMLFQSNSIQLNWNTVPDAISYNLQVSTVSTFVTTIVNQSGISSTSYNLYGSGLSNGIQLFWRVQSVGACLNSEWSEPWSFILFHPIPICICGNENVNSSTSYPAPYGRWYNGARHQMLMRASELINLGMSSGGIINSLSFHVSSLNWIDNMLNFTIRLKNTSVSEITNWDTAGLTQVYFNPSLILPGTGWIVHNFNNPFYWDGESNLLVEVCFNNYPLGYTYNASTYYSITSYISVIYTADDANPNLCMITYNLWNHYSNHRPDMQLGFSPIAINAPTLVSPVNNINNTIINPVMQWNSVFNADSYNLQLSTDSNFESPDYNISGINAAGYQVSELSTNTTYYWRVRAYYNVIPSTWSEVRSFTTTQNENNVLSLQNGWNSISNFISPVNADIESLLSPISDNLVVMKNGNGELYIPEYGIDLLHNWNISDGYQVYMTNPDTLTITGNIIDPANTSINLNAGWNLISYLRNSPMAIEQALAGILNYVIVVKDNYGGLYIPAWNINTIGNMQPGQGYQVYVSQDVVLTYPGD